MSPSKTMAARRQMRTPGERTSGAWTGGCVIHPDGGDETDRTAGNSYTATPPSGMKFDMYTLFFSPTINTSDNTQAVNPLYQYRDSIEVVEDPTINALCGGLGNVMPWFLIGDPGDTDFIEVDYLNGQEIPNIRRMEAPGQLGFIWDIYLDWGISVMDYRGAVKNPGIKVDTKLKLV